MQFSDFYQSKELKPKATGFPLVADQEMFNCLAYKLLKLDDLVIRKEDNSEAKLLCWPRKYYGRLDGHPGEPGLYDDSAEILLLLPPYYQSPCKNSPLVPTTTIRFKDELLERFEEIRTDWFYIPRNFARVGDLPETKVWESDVVTIKHDNDTYQVFRINYEDQTCTLKNLDKKGVTVIKHLRDVQLLNAGPVKIASSGEEIRFRDTKSAAEFQVMLGRYTRMYYPIKQSYNWSPEHAIQMINLSKAHGLLRYRNGISLISLLDEEIGSELMYLTQTNPTTILEV